MSEDGSSPLTIPQVAQRALAAQEGGEPVALLTVVAAPAPGSIGGRIAVTARELIGTLGSAKLDELVAELGRAALGSGERGLQRVEVGGESWELYVEPQHPRPELVIVGAGHIARPLCEITALMDFRVTVIDDRTDYADERWFPRASRVLLVDWEDPFREVDISPNSYIVLVTRGHRYDYECIQHLLTIDAHPAYVGMIGSRRRVTAAFEALIGGGVPPERLEEVHAPIGLDVGAETPEEIAVAIAAELISVRRGGSGDRLTEREGVLKRVARRHGMDEGGRRDDG